MRAPRHPTRLGRASLCAIRATRCLAATVPIARARGQLGSSEGGTKGVAPPLLCSLVPASSSSRGRMQLVDYSDDSESDEPAPPSVRLPRVVAGEQENSTGRAAGRATVSPLLPAVVEPASAGSADKPSQNVQPLRDATNATTAAAPLATGVQADAPAAEQVCSAIPLVLRWGTGRVGPCGARGEVADWACAPGVRERRDLLPAARCARPSLSSFVGACGSDALRPSLPLRVARRRTRCAAVRRSWPTQTPSRMRRTRPPSRSAHRAPLQPHAHSSTRQIVPGADPLHLNPQTSA